MADTVDLQILKVWVEGTSAQIDKELNPKLVQRIGLVELKLDFDAPEPVWTAVLTFKFHRRSNSQSLTGSPETSAAKALDELLQTVRLMKSIGDL